MAIYHLRMSPMSRSSGRSAVAAAAYRAGEDLVNARDGERHDFTRRQGVEHAEIVLPSKADAAWDRSRLALWNAAEAAERRKDARVAREVEVSLPHELTPAARLALVRAFSQDLADRYGVAVDFAIHAPHGATDERNHHAHLMLTTRVIGRDGLGAKSVLELENKKLVAQGLPTTHDQLRSIRLAWEELANLHLARAGMEVRVDHRSHVDRGLAIEPTQHVGVHATQMARRGMEVTRVRLEQEAGRRNAELIQAHPEQVLVLLTAEKSVFDRHDIARALHRAIDAPDAFQRALAVVMASPALVELQPERRTAEGVFEPARYSTREMVAIEQGMAVATDRLLAARDAGVGSKHVAAAIHARPFLSAEQCEAVTHVTGEARIAAVVGLAGAGKSTMLSAAREAWEAGGYRVQGAALAGKAAEGLEESSGIPSRTLASWSKSWERGFDGLGVGDVFVIDEAGMVGSKQLARFIAEADRVGAKVVLVGDPEQLQPIGAGAAFRAVAERAGFASLEGVRRQGEAWQRQASVDFGRHRTVDGLRAYQGHGAIALAGSTEAAQAAIVAEVLADRDLRPEGTRLVLAHRRVNVFELNQAIRAARQARGELVGEVIYGTSEGQRAFAVGDRVLFRQNDRALGVKNGGMGTVERADDGRLGVRLDSAKGEGRGKAVVVDLGVYDAVDHGYATTIHKAQGATVDRAWVLASGSMDRHLTYVAMTRHREGVRLHAGRDVFRNEVDLALRLSRGGAKETTLDYEHERAGYARRRGIGEGPWLDSGIVVPATAVVVPERGRFDGLSLGVGNLPAAGVRAAAKPVREEEAQAKPRGMFAGLKLPVRAAVPEGELARGEAVSPKRSKAEAFTQAVDVFAVAWRDAQRMRGQALPLLAHQEAAMRRAVEGLEHVRPGVVQDLAAALHRQPGIAEALARLQGDELAGVLMKGIRQEVRARQELAREAERARTVEIRRAPAPVPEPVQERTRGRGLSR